MSKIELALKVVKDLRNLADSIEGLTNEMQGEESTEATPTTKEKQGAITLEKVRAVLAEKSQNGKQTEVKALITSFGAKKLTDIDPSKYEELIQKVGEI